MARINLLARDFDSIKQELISILQQTHPALANSLTDNDVLQIFLNFFALIGDILSFQIDVSINEAFIDTATQFESVSRIGKLVGVTPKLPVPTVIIASAALAVPATTDVTIPAGTSINVLGEIFETAVSFTIPAGLTSAHGITFIQGRTMNQTFTASGKANEVFFLSGAPIAEGSIKVTNAFGEAEQVESLALVNGPENKFEIDINEDYSAFIRFGDNVNGAILPAGSTVNVSYRVLGSQPLVILPNVVQTTIQGFTETGNPVSVNIFNPGSGITGSLGDSVETLKNKIKAGAQRTVTKITAFDLNSTIVNLGIVSAVNVVKDSNVVDQINIYIWKRDSVTGKLIVVSQAIIDSLVKFLDSIRPLNVKFQVVPGIVVPIILKIKATTVSFDVNTVIQNVKRAAFMYFALLKPGGVINVVDMINFIFNQVPDLINVQIFDKNNNLFGTIQLKENELADLIAVEVNVTPVG